MILRLLPALALTLHFGLVFGQPAPAPSPEERTRLIEQKLSLIQALLGSPAAKTAESSEDTEARELLKNGRDALARGKAALAEAHLEEAGKSADEALKSVSALSRRLSSGRPALADSAQKKNLEDLEEQLSAYRGALLDLTQDPNAGPGAQRLLASLDTAREEARRLAQAGRLGEAGSRLTDAYRTTVEGLTRLRAGQEVVLSLKFDTPADEFGYEQRRYASGETIADMMIREGRAQGGQRQLVDRFLTQGRELKKQADEHARSGNFRDAVPLMEKANVQLNRALQALGLPAF
jgi:hypothetical protein